MTFSFSVSVSLLNSSIHSIVDQRNAQVFAYSILTYTYRKYYLIIVAKLIKNPNLNPNTDDMDSLFSISPISNLDRSSIAHLITQNTALIEKVSVTNS